MAIQSFSHKALEDLYDTGRSTGIQPQAAKKKLKALMDLIDAAAELGDFHNVSHFHKLRGKRDWYAFHVTANWRLTFKFKNGDASDLDYEDYH